MQQKFKLLFVMAIAKSLVNQLKIVDCRLMIDPYYQEGAIRLSIDDYSMRDYFDWIIARLSPSATEEACLPKIL